MSLDAEPAESLPSRPLARIEPCEAFQSRKWKPGQSGNPAGAGSEYHRAISIARKASVANVQELIRLRDTSPDDRVRLTAATSLHQIAWGKREPPPLDGTEGAGARLLAGMSESELASLRDILTRAAQSASQSGADVERASDGGIVITQPAEPSQD